MYLSVPIA